MDAGCAVHGMKPACYTHSLTTYNIGCINLGATGNIFHNSYYGSPSSIAANFAPGWQAVHDQFQLNTGFCASSVWHAPNKALCGSPSGMASGGCPTFNKYLCAKQGASPAAASAMEGGPGGFFMTGPFAGNVIVKFDMNNGTYVEHFEDRDLTLTRTLTPILTLHGTLRGP